MSIFVCVCVCVCVYGKKTNKKKLFTWGGKTRAALISHISPPSCSLFTWVLVCLCFLLFQPKCVAIVHLQMNLAERLAAAWCIVTFSNEPIVNHRPGFLSAAPACCSSISFIICSCGREIITEIRLLNICSQGHHLQLVCVDLLVSTGNFNGKTIADRNIHLCPGQINNSL